MKTSQYRIISIGYVAENKALSSKFIKVTPIEDLSLISGDIKSKPTSHEIKGIDATATEYSAGAVVDNVITAEWMQYGSNRRTAPDVRRGMRVLIWQTADADKYYWTSMGMDDDLMRLETVVYAWSATKDESVKVHSPDNSYYIEVSSHGKHVIFSTSKANGEPFAYNFQFDCGEGKVTLADDAKNYVQLDSTNTKIVFKNAADSEIVLDKRVIKGKAPDSVTFEAGKGIFLKCGASKVSVLPAEIVLKTPKLTGAK